MAHSSKRVYNDTCTFYIDPFHSEKWHLKWRLSEKSSTVSDLMHTGKCICRFAGIYAY